MKQPIRLNQNKMFEVVLQFISEYRFYLLIAFVAYRWFASKQPIKEVEGAKTVEVHNVNEWNSLMEDAKARDIPVVADFYATWCPPCRRAAPIFAQMSIDYDENTVLFAKVNADTAGDVKTLVGVEAFPTFKVFKGGLEVDSVVGWNQAGVVSAIEKAGAKK